MEKKSSGGGFFQRWFGGGVNPLDTNRERTTSPFRETASPNRDEDDYATIDRIRYGKREMSMPASSRNVHFIDEVAAQRAAEAAMRGQYRPRATGNPRGPVSRVAPSSLNQLDEATLDLLRLSTEPTVQSTISFTSSRKVNPAADYLPKAASTSSVNKIVRTQDDGRLRLANIFTPEINQMNGNISNGENFRANGLSPQAIRRNEGQLSPTSSRREATETVVDYEEHRKGPPVIRTTVEGKLRMEKIVGADLITVDSCVSSAWTVRDTVTNYKIKTTIGKKSLILEEIKNGQSKYKITLIENGEIKMEREASLDIPEFMNKKDYLTEVSQRLLNDLREDGEGVSAITHVEIEVVEDVTNILKTYVIGESADDWLAEDVQKGLYYEETADKTPPLVEERKVEKIYIDTLEKDEEQQLDKVDILLTQEGQYFEGEGQLNRVRRLESEESVEKNMIVEPRCAHTFADCDLTRKEDSSTFIVRISIPFIHAISIVLRRTRLRRQEKTQAIEIETAGQQFEQEMALQRVSRYETTDSLEDEAQKRNGEPTEQLTEKAREHDITRFSDAQVEGGSYEMYLDGQRLVGTTVFKRRERAVDSESSEEIPRSIVVPKESTAMGGQYEMEIQGVSLRGETKFRKERCYESESDESVTWSAGSPTIVDLIKKESHSYFEVIFETPNNYEPSAITLKRVVIKRETCTISSLFMQSKWDSEDAFIVLKDKIIWEEAFAGRELSEEYIHVSIGLQNLVKKDKFEQEAESNLSTVTTSEVERRLREMKEEQAVMFYGFENTSPIRDEIDIVMTDKGKQLANFFAPAAELEHVNYSSSFFHSAEILDVERTSKTANVILVQAFIHETSEEHTTTVVFLQKMLGALHELTEIIEKDKLIKEAGFRTRASSENTINTHCSIAKSISFPMVMTAEKNLRTSNVTSLIFHTLASKSILISSTLTLNKGSSTMTAATKVQDCNRQHTDANVVESGNAQEFCAVMMKNTGGAHSRVEVQIADTVTGRFIDLDSRTISKQFHLNNYRTMLPPRGETRVEWPLASVRSASFHLSNLSEHIKIYDENFNQDLRIRRKNATFEVTVYILYRWVLGNYAHASMNINIEDIYKTKLLKEVSIQMTESRKEFINQQIEMTDEFEQQVDSRHIITERAILGDQVVIHLNEGSVAVGQFRQMLEQCPRNRDIRLSNSREQRRI